MVDVQSLAQLIFGQTAHPAGVPISLPRRFRLHPPIGATTATVGRLRPRWRRALGFLHLLERPCPPALSVAVVVLETLGEKPAGYLDRRSAMTAARLRSVAGVGWPSTWLPPDRVTSLAGLGNIPECGRSPVPAQWQTQLCLQIAPVWFHYIYPTRHRGSPIGAGTTWY